MGDLINKLPTDNTPVPMEERENFMMLFPEEVEHQPSQSHPSQQTSRKDHNKLKKEVAGLFVFMLVFFILNLPFVKTLIREYIPMCNKSWILTNAVQSIIFAFVLWIVMNAEYSRV